MAMNEYFGTEKEITEEEASAIVTVRDGNLI
jgi:hypothetical protein